MASATSKSTEIKLTNVARASLEELLADYYDYLRIHDLAVWEKSSLEVENIRALAYAGVETYETYQPWVESDSAETAANAIICLIFQANYLLDRQIRFLENDFMENGGIREKMYNARKENRNQNRGRAAED
jgi:four helix bundle suffix protein